MASHTSIRKGDGLMKKIINKKIYNTETATLIAEYSNGLTRGDFNHIYEDLYVTKLGQFFLHVEGGPLTCYSETDGRNTWGIETIILLDSRQTYNWLEKRSEYELIDKYFSDMVSEG